MTYAGYYTIPLPSAVTLTSGQKFSIVVKMTTPGYNYPCAMEEPISGYCSGATAHAGESFISSSGSSWSDLTTSYPNTNFCIKGFTSAGNTPPVAANDAYTVSYNTPLSVAAPGVLANDSDADNNPLTAALVANPSHGTAVLSANGAFTYTPAQNYTGPDSFTYKANDGTADSNVATVSLTVQGIRQVRIVSSPGIAGGTVQVPVMLDAQGDENTLGFSLQFDPAALSNPVVLLGSDDAGASLLVNNSQVASGRDGIVISLSSGAAFAAGTRQIAMVTFTIATGAPSTTSITFGDQPTARSVVNAGSGALPVNWLGGSVQVNHPPVAANDVYLTNKGIALTVAAPGVLGNDSDADGDTMTASKVSDPTHGTVVFSPNGSFTYTPATGYAGPDSFTYKANDGRADSNVATISITVNTPPVAAGESYVIDQDTTLTIPAPGVLGNDTDADGNPLTALKVTDPSHGAVTLNANGSFTYTPAAGYSGPDSFTYKANDGHADSNIATVAITVNGAPTAVGDAYATDQNTALAVAAPGVLGNDSDPNGDAITAVKGSDPANGSLQMHADGSFTYTPNPNFAGTDHFTYYATDARLASKMATVTITVRPTGYEADVAPRGDGDGTVTIADWVQMGRFAAALDTPASPGEFQRADCAPRALLGDGVITMADWVQAGRYAVGLDPLAPVGGPTGAPTGAAAQSRMPMAAGSSTRGKCTLSIGSVTAPRGRTCTVRVTLTAPGNANALGFSLNFDAARLKCIGVKLVGAAAGATLNVNTATRGCVGVGLMLPLPHVFAAGAQPVLECTFTPLATAPPGMASITFSDRVITREVVAATATVLPAVFVNGGVRITK